MHVHTECGAACGRHGHEQHQLPGCAVLLTSTPLTLYFQQIKVRRMSETPTTTTSQKSIAIRLPFVSQYASHLYRSTFVPLGSKEREILSVLLPFVSQYASHLYCNTPPICIAILLGKSWWLWSPDCSP